MEEEMVNITKPNSKEESSDSSIFPASKRSRAERFKSVIPQQNERIWVGTFKSYNSSARKHRNLAQTNRDGSYSSSFSDALRSQQGEIEIGLNLSSIHGEGEFSCTLLFQKELTPSDVGKLNRLVIPKRYAVKHFPSVPDQEGEGMNEQVQLEFYDKAMSLWKFRYCYWKSSQSFVFTRGWNRFVKEKGLRSNDTVAFYMYESRRGRHFGKSFLVIDVAGKDGQQESHKPCVASSPITSRAKGIKLFGVQID